MAYHKVYLGLPQNLVATSGKRRASLRQKVEGPPVKSLSKGPLKTASQAFAPGALGSESELNLEKMRGVVHTRSERLADPAMGKPFWACFAENLRGKHTQMRTKVSSVFVHVRMWCSYHMRPQKSRQRTPAVRNLDCYPLWWPSLAKKLPVRRAKFPTKRRMVLCLHPPFPGPRSRGGVKKGHSIQEYRCGAVHPL